MNWVGGARSRIKQSHEKKIQKEFFERQKLAKKVNIQKQWSPKGQKKPVSLDLLSLQTINLTHGGATTQRRQPVKVMLGDRTNLLSRRQEDLELPMSPIRHPSNLTFTDIKTDKDLHKNIYPSNKSSHSESLLQVVTYPSHPETSHAFRRISQVEHYSETLPVPNRNVFDESLMSESVLSYHDKCWEPPQYQKKLPQEFNAEHGNFQLKNRNEDLLAFQRTERAKHMSISRPSLKHLPYQKERHVDKPSTSYDMYNEENPTTISAFKIPPKAPRKLEGGTHKETSQGASNNGLSDKERKTLLGLDLERELDCTEDRQCVPVFKKAKTSSFEEMINNYEKPAKNKTNLNTVSKGASKSRHEEWRKFTHEKESPHVTNLHQVPDTSKASEAPVDKTSLFFRKQAPKKQAFPKRRPLTVLQELLCLDEDLNNSDLFLTQDFTFEERLDIDFEEPLRHGLEYNTQHVTTITDNLPVNHYIPPVKKPEIINEPRPKERLVQLLKSEEQPEEQLHESKEPACSSRPKEQSRELQSNAPSTSVGIQCNRIDVIDKGTQTIGKTSSVLDAGTQTEVMISKSAMTDTNDLLPLPSDQPSNSLKQFSSTTSTDDHLALAQSTIVWQSLMIKLWKINAKYDNKS